MKNALIIIAKEGFQDHEYEPTRRELEAAGFSVTIASTEAGICTGKFGGKVEATLALKNVKVGDYHVIAFIGGPGAGELKDNADALRIANETVRENIPLGAICIAPTILAKAKVLEGRKATVWNKDGKQGDFLAFYGAQYTGDSVTVDGRIVTADGPESAEQFGRTLASL